jgi:glutamine amidotransferase-like uncharacterized protein
MIKIYYDNGVDQASHDSLRNSLSIRKPSNIDAQAIIKTAAWEEAALLIFPGGRDRPYHTALKGVGNQRIRTYVENGGCYLGICAGAYYGAKDVEFDRGGKLEVVESRELNFFPGIARGPVYGSGTFFYDSEEGSQASLISNLFGIQSLKVYYNGGCSFVDAEKYPQVKVLSRYLGVEGEPAAIISISIGKGKVILSGVHLEVRASDPFVLPHVKEGLEPFEKDRGHLFTQLIKMCFPN